MFVYREQIRSCDIDLPQSNSLNRQVLILHGSLGLRENNTNVRKKLMSEMLNSDSKNDELFCNICKSEGC